MGPTASGKTALALKLVEQFPCDIISVDSALVYRGMDIGSAKPNQQEQAAAPHRLIDICDPSEAYSAGQFRQDCLQHIEEIHSQGRVPLLVGGTMLYFRALTQMDDLPQSDPALRQDLQQRLKTDGLAALVAELQARDPAGAKRVELQNPQRVLRALEMVTLSGESLVELWQGTKPSTLPWPTLKLVVAPERAVLHQRIAMRLAQMFDNGFVEEVESLYQRGDLAENLPAIRAVGYRQVWQALDGVHDIDKAHELALYATRQLAKRQLTWLRKEPDCHWFDPLAPESETELMAKVGGFLEKAKV
jgi:tRNA dimethylallyltransferase